MSRGRGWKEERGRGEGGGGEGGDVKRNKFTIHAPNATTKQAWCDEIRRAMMKLGERGGERERGWRSGKRGKETPPPKWGVEGKERR